MAMTFKQARNLCPTLDHAHYGTNRRPGHNDDRHWHTRWVGKTQFATYNLEIVLINEPTSKLHGHPIKAMLIISPIPAAENSYVYWRGQWKNDDLEMVSCNKDIFDVGWIALKDSDGNFL